MPRCWPNSLWVTHQWRKEGHWVGVAKPPSCQNIFRSSFVNGQKKSEETFIPRLVRNVPHDLQSRIQTLWMISGGVGI